jgi:23S rRNA (uridine2552-2'-O)-methyltransferase
LLKTLRGIFQTAKTFKPEACRSGSFETYLVGMHKLQ